MTIKELRKFIIEDEESFGITEGRKDIGFVAEYKDSCHYKDYAEDQLLKDDFLFAKGSRLYLVMGDAA
jgi:hypothetical protein